MPNELENLVLLGLRGENDIVETISRCLGYDKKTIESHSRCRGIVRVRDLIVYLLREYGNLSYPVIGRLLGGRDHTTVLHAYRKMKRNIKERPEHKTELEELIQGAGAIMIKKTHLVFKNIPERNSKILKLWQEGFTLQKISNILNITRERVRQIVRVTIRQMAINESISRNIIIDPDVLVEEESKKRKILKESRREKVLPVKKERRWSRYYVACRLCGTTVMPHIAHGLCERCSGHYQGERRKNIIERHLNSCGLCGISHGDALRKYGRDFYITKSQQVLCRSCFLQITGEKLGNRVRRSKKLI